MPATTPGRVSLLVAAACDAPGTGGANSAHSMLQVAPELATHPMVAMLLGDDAAVARELAESPAFATTRDGPFEVEPLLYLCFSGLAAGDRPRASGVTRVAKLLLANGANPNAFVNLRPDRPQSRITALCGAAAVVDNLELVLALLMAGADPNDGVSMVQTAARGLVAPLESLIAAGGDLNSIDHPLATTPIHYLLDVQYAPPMLEWLLDHGADPNVRLPESAETALHVAVRRRRRDAAALLLDHGADIDALTAGGKSAYAHAARRGFDEVAALLRERGARTTLNLADELAVALTNDDLEGASVLIDEHPGLVPQLTGEEARILPDLAGRDGALDAVRLLLDAGAEPTAPGLDGGTALHQAAWFGQPAIATLLCERGAPLDVICSEHESTPLGWVAHGSRYSGGASERSDRYVQLARILLEAGAPLASPRDAASDPHGRWLLADASDAVAAVLREFGAQG